MKRILNKVGLSLFVVGIVTEITVVVIQFQARLFTSGLAFNLPLMFIMAGLIIVSINEK